MVRTLRWLGLGLIVLALLFSSWSLYRQRLAAANAPPLVDTATVRTGDIEVAVTGTGTIQPSQTADLTPTAAGTVLAVKVREGDAVTAGQVLAVVDDDHRQLQHQLEQAQTQLAADQRKLTALQQPTPGTAAQLAAAQAAIRQDQLNLAQDAADIANLQVASPAGGTVLSVSVQAGDFVTSGRSLATIGQGSLAARIEVAESDVTKLHVGDQAGLVVPALSVVTTGTVQRIALAPDQQVRGTNFYSVWLAFANPPAGLRQGLGTAATFSLTSGTVSAGGSVDYTNTVSVTARSNGTVATLPSVGDQVEAGQILFTLTNPLLLDKQEVDAQRLAADRAQLQQLETPAAASADQITAQEARIQQDANQVSVLQEQLAGLVIRAPYDGVVADVRVRPGDRVLLNTPLITVANVHGLTAQVAISELDIPKLKLGMAAQITVDALPGQPLSGKVEAISPVGKSSNGVSSFLVTISLPDNPLLRAGMSATASIPVARAQGVLLVPVEAVVSQGDRGFVRVLRGGKLTTQRVEVGLRNDTLAEIRSGLQVGDVVVTGLPNTNAPGNFNLLRNFGPRRPEQGRPAGGH